MKYQRIFISFIKNILKNHITIIIIILKNKTFDFTAFQRALERISANNTRKH